MIGFKWFKFGGRNAAAAPQCLTPENLETAAMPTKGTKMIEVSNP